MNDLDDIGQSQNVIVHNTPSHSCLIQKESMQNCRRCRADMRAHRFQYTPLTSLWGQQGYLCNLGRSLGQNLLAQKAVSVTLGYWAMRNVDSWFQKSGPTTANYPRATWVTCLQGWGQFNSGIAAQFQFQFWNWNLIFCNCYRSNN